jgi:uncharacterized protein (DUF4415 family)
MKAEYDMKDARRATEFDHLNRLRADKTQVTLVLDDDLLDALRRSAARRGIGYQTLIAFALREYVERPPLDEETLRRILREELHSAA